MAVKSTGVPLFDQAATEVAESGALSFPPGGSCGWPWGNGNGGRRMTRRIPPGPSPRR